MPIDIDHLEIHKNPRAKRLALRVDSCKGVVRLVIPPRTNMTKAKNFAWRNREWIIDKINRLPTPIYMQDNQIVPIFGQDTQINICFDHNVKRTKILMESGILYVQTNLHNPAMRIERFLKNIFKNDVSVLAKEKALSIHETIGGITVRDTKTRWGSCSHDGKLSFSWRLIFAPYHAFDYVVAHEVAHLVHMDHGRDFWNLCNTLSDNYQTGKAWMKEHGHSLHRYRCHPPSQYAIESRHRTA